MFDSRVTGHQKFFKVTENTGTMNLEVIFLSKISKKKYNKNK